MTRKPYDTYKKITDKLLATNLGKTTCLLRRMEIATELWLHTKLWLMLEKRYHPTKEYLDQIQSMLIRLGDKRIVLSDDETFIDIED